MELRVAAWETLVAVPIVAMLLLGFGQAIRLWKQSLKAGRVGSARHEAAGRIGGRLSRNKNR